MNDITIAVNLASEISKTLSKLGLDSDQRTRANREIAESIAQAFEVEESIDSIEFAISE